MRPFAQQLLSWQSADPQKRAAALVLEVKGDFCHDIRADLEDAGRGDDYIELALGGRWQWNPLASAMDSYSLAYTVASLLNQLFGKSREPFWQQAYTNLIRWLIELHRALPDQWVTFRDLYHCAIDPERIGQKIEQARKLDGPPPTSCILIPATSLCRHANPLTNYEWEPASGDQPRSPTASNGSRSSTPAPSPSWRTVRPSSSPYDGTNAQPATRVYLKPHYLPRDRPYWRAREAGQL